MTKRQIEKELNRQATLFEEQCKQSAAETDPEEKRQVTFKELAEEYLTEQERTHTIKVSSLERLKSCRELTYKAIGNLFVVGQTIYIGADHGATPSGVSAYNHITAI